MFLSVLCYGQDPLEEILITDSTRTIAEVFDSLSTGLIPTRIPFGVLYDRVHPWSGLNTWQDSDTVYPGRLFQAWWDLEESHVDSLSRPHQYNNMRNLSWDKLQQVRLPLIAVAYRFGQIAHDAFTDGRMRVENNVFLFDNNLPTTPYDTSSVRLAGIATSEVDSGRTYLLDLSPDLMLTNLEQPLLSVQVQDLLNNQQYTVTPGGEAAIIFNETGNHPLLFTLSFAGGVVAHSKQIISVLGNSAKTTGVGCSPTSDLIESKFFFQGYGETDATKSYGDYHIYYHYTAPGSGVCERVLRKPIVILDGFDPLDGRKFDKIYEIYLSYSNSNLGEDLRNDGYDVVILNFPVLGSTTLAPAGSGINDLYIPQTVAKSTGGTVNRNQRDGGADYIERNAYVFINLVEKLNYDLGVNGSKEQLVVVGPSMGGLISRYGLAFMEKAYSGTYGTMNHNTRLWVSFDSPNWGANIPVGLQEAFKFYGDKSQSQTAKDAYQKQLQSPAARQLLLEQIDGLNGNAPYRATFSNLLQNFDYPNKTRRIALVNGSVNGFRTHLDGAPLILADGIKSNTTVFHAEINCMPAYGTTATVFDGKVSIPSYLFGNASNWVIGLTSYYLTVPKTNNNTFGSLDGVPGGTFGALKTFYDSTDKTLASKGLARNWAIQKDNHCFIPTVSALGIIGGKSMNWGNSISISNILCNSQTPFSAIYAPANNEPHVTLTDANVAWLKNELKPVKIVGPDYPVACKNTLYYLDSQFPPGTTVNWLSESGNISWSLGTNAFSVNVKPYQAGIAGVLSATITKPDCSVNKV